MRPFKQTFWTFIIDFGHSTRKFNYVSLSCDKVIFQLFHSISFVKRCFSLFLLYLNILCCLIDRIVVEKHLFFLFNNFSFSQANSEFGLFTQSIKSWKSPQQTEFNVLWNIYILLYCESVWKMFEWKKCQWCVLAFYNITQWIFGK